MQAEAPSINLAVMGEAVRTQENRATSHPIFLVESVPLCLKQGRRR